MKISELCNFIFRMSIENYHLMDNVHAELKNPFESESIEHILFAKNWIDTVQWHQEDLIRNPKIDPLAGLKIKREIDILNQKRTNTVEQLDDWFLALFSEVTPHENATLNTESPGWAVDRLSILALKIYHMEEETQRKEVSEEHRALCASKLSILLEQQTDLSTAIDELIEEMAAGRKKMKVYRQMKMYNDPSLNPVLYNNNN